MTVHFMVRHIIDKRDGWRWLRPWWHAASDGYEESWSQEMRNLEQDVHNILLMAQNLSWASPSLRIQVQRCIPDFSIQRIITVTDTTLMGQFALHHVLFGLLAEDWMSHRVRLTAHDLSRPRPIFLLSDSISQYLDALATDTRHLYWTCRALRWLFCVIRGSDFLLCASTLEFRRLYDSVEARARPFCLEPALRP